jgi:hypothetical protein
LSEAITNDDQNIKHILASGRSYQKHERERKLYFISKENAEENTKTHTERELKGVCKPRKHHGHYENYTFDTHEFLTDIKSSEPGSIVIWAGLARKYNLVNKKNTLPAKGIGSYNNLLKKME